MITKPDHSTPSPPPSKTTIYRCALFPVFLFALITFPIILSGSTTGRGASDDLYFHWPAIQSFSQQLPTPDISSYSSATTPGYHLSLSVLHNLGASRTLIQLIAWLWSAALIALLALQLAPHYRKKTVLILLPLFSSMYVLFPAIWLLPDNAGWLGVLIILLLSLNKQPTKYTLLAASSTLILLTFFRQVHIWIAASIWMSAWVGSTSQSPTLKNLFNNTPSRITRTTLAMLATLPAFLLLAYLYTLWDGLVPPLFQSHHQSFNPSTPAFILTQIAIISCFFAHIMIPRLLQIWNEYRTRFILVMTIAIIIAIIPESTLDQSQGRYSGSWNLTKLIPSFYDRSPLILIGAPLGALASIVWRSLIPQRDAWVFLATILAFTLAQSANHAAWQRYHEPMLLIVGILILARSPQAISSAKHTVISTLALSLFLASITIPTMLKAKVVVLDDPLIDAVNQLNHTIEPYNPAKTTPNTPVQEPATPNSNKIP